jgi:hypothetical protein
MMADDDGVMVQFALSSDQKEKEVQFRYFGWHHLSGTIYGASVGSDPRKKKMLRKMTPICTRCWRVCVTGTYFGMRVTPAEDWVRSFPGRRFRIIPRLIRDCLATVVVFSKARFFCLRHTSQYLISKPHHGQVKEGRRARQTGRRRRQC